LHVPRTSLHHFAYEHVKHNLKRRGNCAISFPKPPKVAAFTETPARPEVRPSAGAQSHRAKPSAIRKRVNPAKGRQEARAKNAFGQATVSDQYGSSLRRCAGYAAKSESMPAN
jgi:hypothetical protein